MIFYFIIFCESTRIIEVQGEMTERAIELLNLSEDSDLLLLDIGCGSGISGEVISDNNHMWVGFDISRHMLSLISK